jgi:pterin-4a-carbinolamine dehydratase
MCIAHSNMPSLVFIPRNTSTSFRRRARDTIVTLCTKGRPSTVSICHRVRGFSSSNENEQQQERPDPFARRPTAKCDPYGQGGKPLPKWEANNLLSTLHPEWKIEQEQGEGQGKEATPQAIVREFAHPDFITGGRFVAKLAAVAQLHAHFPSIHLERKIRSRQKAWQVVTSVRCHTLVLGGLSTHDFHLAMVSNLCIIPISLDSFDSWQHKYT